MQILTVLKDCLSGAEQLAGQHLGRRGRRAGAVGLEAAEQRDRREATDRGGHGAADRRGPAALRARGARRPREKAVSRPFGAGKAILWSIFVMVFNGFS